MECTECKTPNRDIAKYCKRCGTALVTADAGVSAGAPADILGGLIGLDEIRTELRGMINVIEGMKRDGNFVRMNYNLILIGNSGTAKSLIGDLFFQALKRLQVVTKEKPIFVDGSEFVDYDVEAVTKLIANAVGGMVIIDNAQGLIDGGEAVSSLKRLLVEMDNHQGDPVVILSGLPGGLREFVRDEANTNFTGRFRKTFFITDYDTEVLQEIITKVLGTRYGFSLSQEAEAKLTKRCKWLSRALKNPDSQMGASNGYLAMREVDAIVHQYYTRGGQNKTVEAGDISDEVVEEKSAEEILKTLDSFIGMQTIKKDIRDLYNRMKGAGSQAGGAKPVLHAVLTGNPGTGKTTVVRTLGEIYAALGVLDTGHVVEVDRSKLVAGYSGQTAIQVNNAVESAFGGVLFVDEAYALKQGDNDSFGQEAIDTLLKRVEDDRDKFCCIVAGYQTEMKDFMSSNSGLESRFPKRFHLEDYTAEELLQIFLLNVKGEGYTITPEAQERAAAYLHDRVARKTKNFANGREARNLFEKARNRLATRLTEEGGASGSGASGGGAAGGGSLGADAYTVLTEADIPSNREEGAVTVEEAMERLDSLTGLGAVKEKIKELIDTLELDRMRGQVKPLGEHFLFTGNPGTGKTTVARIVADILYAIGLLPSRTLVEADRAAMVAAYTGQTAQQVNSLVDKAMGGVLFIDEAYTLNQGDGDSFGLEAINTLLKRLEDDRGKFVCIAAGYSKEMSEFLASNSGLQSRFTTTIEFEDYNAQELVAIFRNLAGKEGYQLSTEADAAIEQMFEAVVARKTKNFGNAREVRKIFEQTRARLSRRIVALKKEGIEPEELQKRISVIEREDLPIAKDDDAQAHMQAALAELEEQIGLGGVKKKVKELIDVLEVQKLRGQQKPLGIHFVFTGNPGTGKTTIARILARVFHGIGLLPSDNLVETDRSGLVAGYLGQTALKVNQAVDRAMGGMLFVDEAYALKQRPDDQFGQEAIDTLLKRMEDDRGKFVVVAAGYKKEMQQFLESNSGLTSRFSDHIDFEDYNGEELTRIFQLFAKKDGYQLAEGVAEQVRVDMDRLYQSRDANFGNARSVRKYYSKAVELQSSRLVKQKQEGTLDTAALSAEANMIRLEDVPKEGAQS